MTSETSQKKVVKDKRDRFCIQCQENVDYLESIGAIRFDEWPICDHYSVPKKK